MQHEILENIDNTEKDENMDIIEKDEVKNDSKLEIEDLGNSASKELKKKRKKEQTMMTKIRMILKMMKWILTMKEKKWTMLKKE